MNNNNKKYPILVVDDERKITMSLEAFFKTQGHEMYTALDGKSANKIIDEARPELVILDIRMPGIDGKEILRNIRRSYSDIKVIVITAYEEEAKEVEEIGVDGFFIKPVVMADLIERITYVLETDKETRVYPTKKVKEEVIKKIPKAKILFVEPNINVYSYTCGMFSSKEFNKGEFEVEVAYSTQEVMAMFGDNSVYGFSPDIIVMYDINKEFDELDKFADYLLHISFRPKEIIVHGIFPRNETEIARLERKGVVYCDQNVLTDEHFRQMNQKLIDTVAKECVKLGLIKK